MISIIMGLPENKLMMAQCDCILGMAGSGSRITEILQYIYVKDYQSHTPHENTVYHGLSAVLDMLH
jgi:hypothetical protein